MKKEINIPKEITRRDFFAAEALRGLAANPKNYSGNLVDDAVELADELIDKLDGNKKETKNSFADFAIIGIILFFCLYQIFYK